VNKIKQISIGKGERREERGKEEEDYSLVSIIIILINK
jgi:hypothetical protein